MNKSKQCFENLDGLTSSQENLLFAVFWKHHFEQAEINLGASTKSTKYSNIPR